MHIIIHASATIQYPSRLPILRSGAFTHERINPAIAANAIVPIKYIVSPSPYISETIRDGTISIASVIRILPRILRTLLLFIALYSCKNVM